MHNTSARNVDMRKMKRKGMRESDIFTNGKIGDNWLSLELLRV